MSQKIQKITASSLYVFFSIIIGLLFSEGILRIKDNSKNSFKNAIKNFDKSNEPINFQKNLDLIEKKFLREMQFDHFIKIT